MEWRGNQGTNAWYPFMGPWLEWWKYERGTILLLHDSDNDAS